MSPKVRIDVKRDIIQLIADELNSGKYFLPSFQRQYVWNEDDIKDLIDSIIKNYPIGTIILWKPSKESISEIDPFSKPFMDKNGTGQKEIFYIIDGQQRLTSLMLLLNNWQLARGGEIIKCEPITYNPANNKFYKSTKRGIDLSKLIKAFYKFDETAIAELKKTTSPENYKIMEDMVKGILNKYPIPICIMETDSEDETTFRDMAEAFIRVNKFGIRIGNLELMLSFLAGAVGGELKQKIRNLYEEFNNKFEIELQPIIRFSFSNFDLKQTQISKVEQFKINIKKIMNYNSVSTADIFSKCNKSFELTINLLNTKLGLSNSRFLPSQNALIPIAKYIYIRNIESLEQLDESDVKNIINWFVLTSFNGYYSSQPDTKLDRDMELITAAYFPYEDLIGNMQNRKARIKIRLEDIKRGLDLNVLRLQGRAHLFLLYTILVKEQADDWNGILLDQQKVINLARHHIFPKDYLEKNLELDEPETKEIMINNLSNITFIHKDINSEIEDTPPEEYLNEYISSAKKHFIPTDSNLWSINQYNTFLEYRIRQIYAAGKKYFGDIFD